MNTQEEVTREFKKGENGKYEFIMTTPKFTRVETISKETVLETYANNREELNKYYEQLKQVNKELKNLAPPSKEVEDFIRLSNEAQKANKYFQNKQASDGILNMIKLLEQQQHDMEVVEPSLKRMKK